jgi:uncharacterized protein YjbI with pentapeptide repeats
MCTYKIIYRTSDGQKGYTDKEHVCRNQKRDGDLCYSHSVKEKKSPWEIQLIFGDASLSLPMVGTYLRNADVNFMAFPSREWSASDFQGSKLSACTLSGLNSIGTNFSNCDLSFANFGYSVLSESAFDNSNLQNTDFLGVRAEKTSFKNANFTSSNLIDINFRDSDMEGAIFDQIQMSPNALDGAKNIDKIVWKSTKSKFEVFGYEEKAMAQYQYLEKLYADLGKVELAKQFKADFDRAELNYQTKRTLSDSKAPKKPFSLPQWAWILIVSFVSIALIWFAIYLASRKNKQNPVE